MSSAESVSGDESESSKSENGSVNNDEEDAESVEDDCSSVGLKAAV